ncbi:MAG TPA: protein kinase [Polyangiales bacterium]|nr:protein kinase [Polyangiales bacterium]
MTAPIPSLKGEKVRVDTAARSESGSREGGATAHVAARFDVQKLLGEGGMGSVFVAQDRGLGRIVALKRLRDGLETNRDAMRRFILEAQIGAQLEHPNIVPLYSFEQSEGGAPAIAMQLLEGTTMASYILAAAGAPREARGMHGEYSLKERVGMLLGVCEAIHFAHERGVIHRDLKPDNVMLGRYREVYVMDWGLARVDGSAIEPSREPSANDSGRVPRGNNPTDTDLSTFGNFELETLGETPSNATRQGSVFGTPQFMPPEQALGQVDRVGPPADQYSLGVMLQELATLKPARSYRSATEALMQAADNYLEPRIDVDEHAVHPALGAIIARATQKEPADRYPSVRDLTDDLRRFIRDEPVSVFPEGVARRLVRAAARRPALSVAIFSAFGFIASAVLVGAILLDAQRTAEQAREMEKRQRVTLAVSSRAHAIDVELSHLAADVKGIGAATLELLERDSSEFDRTPHALPRLLSHVSYGGAAVSFEGSVVVWPGKTPEAKLPAGAAKLRRLERWLRDAVVESLPDAERSGSVEEQNAALSAGHAEVLRAFVGLEDGAFTQFPAREVTADPRKRPWYAMASRDPALHWTRPVVDATKKTLRISALFGLQARGKFVGAAGCDMRVSALAKKLALELPSFRRAYLVTEDGKIAVSDTLEATVLARVVNPDEPLDLPDVDDPTLAARIASKDRGGYVDSGDRLLIFTRLVSTPWTYVAELDKARYIAN